MRTILKKIIFNLPRPIKASVFQAYEALNFHKTRAAIKREIGDASASEYAPVAISGKKPRILFYHISGLSFGGTEKFLQIIAKHIDKKKYDVLYMYSPKPRSSSGNIPLDGRKPYLENSGSELVEFTYESLDQKYPYIVHGMKPSVFDIIKEKQIDLFMTAGSGYAEYPFNVIRDMPVLLINIFGSPAVQKNIFKHISISKEVDSKIAPIVPSEKREVIYIQSERPDPTYKQLGSELRTKFGIKETDVVFGRIGRADDGIFDPIGIRAFAKVVKQYPEAHYIIMSPPPIVVDIVKTENILNVHYCTPSAVMNIQNVHYCTPSAVEADVWAFHYSLDALAHFRLDGESFGLNIAESMIAGNPIITHKSHIWNAHLEYLEPSFSFIANKDDVDAYADHMVSIIKAKKDGTILQMKQSSAAVGEKLFLIENSIGKIEQLVDAALKADKK